MTENHSLHTCATEKPELYQPVRLYFEDEIETAGQWTGRAWWSHGHEVAPVWWQYADDGEWKMEPFDFAQDRDGKWQIGTLMKVSRRSAESFAGSLW